MAIHLTSQKILKDWTDYNNHMNVAYYVLIFDLYGAEKLMTTFNMGEASAKSTKKSTMVVESHITYNQEVKEGDTIEILSLYVDLGQRKVSEFEEDKIKLMEDFISNNKNNFNAENLMFSSKLKK